MNNFEVTKDGKNYWISRSVAVVAYVYAVFDDELHILANKRGSGLPNNVGKWNCPSGYLDYNETLEEAAAREVYEETGVKISPNDLVLFGIESEPTRANQNVIIRYKTFLDGEYAKKVRLTDEHSEPQEVDDIQWIPMSKLDGYDWVSDKHLQYIKNYKFEYCKIQNIV